jgi:hypothetical protein
MRFILRSQGAAGRRRRWRPRRSPARSAGDAGGGCTPAQDPRDVARIQPPLRQLSAQIEGPILKASDHMIVIGRKAMMRMQG